MAYLRDNISYFNVSDQTGQFKIAKKKFTQQFSQIYFARLQALRPIILKQLAVLDESLHIGRVLDVEEGKESYIIGTVFCESIDRPNVFEEVERDQISNYKIPKNVKYVNENPIIFLEDESGRIELDISRLTNYPWVTGTTVGLKGTADSSGKFFVDQLVEPGIPPLARKTCPDHQNEAKYVALVSGLNYGKENADFGLERTRMMELLNGSLHPEFGMNIVKLIIVGNTMSAPIKLSNEFKKKYGHEVAKYKVDHLYQIDRELTNLSRNLEIEIMPGEDDLSTLTLPQHPVPKSLFPNLSKVQNVNFTTNPCLFDVNNIRMLGCSGQNIDDICRHVITDDRILIAEKTLAWRNLAPTTPDSLYCYPFYEKDPFVLNESPHVYFIGNQAKFDTKLIENEGTSTRIILVPDFSETRIMVLVNINDLSVFPLSFDHNNDLIEMLLN